MTTEQLSDTQYVITLENGDRITLIGTAHVSQNSVNEVEKAIETINPDHICLELDEGRYNSRKKTNDYSSMDLKKIFKEGKVFLVLANTALASFQKKMGQNTGSAPGEEILLAGHLAEEKNIPFSLCDRDITVTFKRAWRKSSFFNKAKLITTLISAAFDKEEFKPEELEALKKTDSLQEMMNGIAKELPSVKEVLIDERDRCLAANILKAPGHNKLAVIGAGHIQGIIRTIEKAEKKEISTDISGITKTPAPSKTGKIVGVLVPLGILAFIFFQCITYGFNQGLRYFALWAASNAAGTSLLAILSLAHPLNWLLCAVMGPVSVMSPVIGVGMFAGLAESELRKPKVKDFENMPEDIRSFRMWFKNRILHSFMLFFTTSLGSILGTFVLFPVVLRLTVH